MINYEDMGNWSPNWHYCNASEFHYCHIWYSLSGLHAIPDVLNVAFILNSFNECPNMCMCTKDGTCFKNMRYAEVHFIPFCICKSLYIPSVAGYCVVTEVRNILISYNMNKTSAYIVRVARLKLLLRLYSRSPICC
jgi:hypothetical protein